MNSQVGWHLAVVVSDLSNLSKLARDNNIASKTDEEDRLHTMFLAMADARAVLIKLADRLHNIVMAKNFYATCDEFQKVGDILEEVIEFMIANLKYHNSEEDKDEDAARLSLLPNKLFVTNPC
ncbi:hypothetical protein Droror1_Dr00015003 [Drosera rotundifolia]